MRNGWNGRNGRVRAAHALRATAVVTAVVAAGAPSVAFADGGRVSPPGIVSGEGGLQGVRPVGAPGVASGAQVDAFVGHLRSVTGLEPAQRPTVEKYTRIGDSLTVALQGKGRAYGLNVTRETVDGDVPVSVLSSPGDETRLTGLPKGGRLMTAVGKDGVRVTTLTAGGRLTSWEAPRSAAGKPYAVEELTKWATDVAARTPGGVAVSASTPTSMGAGETGVAAKAAKPRCRLIQPAPIIHGQRVTADVAMLCNRRGKGNFATALRQYRGGGLWKTVDVRGYTNEQGDSFPVILRFSCSHHRVAREYRSVVTNASLRVSGGAWWGTHGVWSRPQYIHCR
ncbi:hypothetical protein [Streptomyces sp. I05A-00742]|uniref:hypothetical protein n=1 Tax=Streptomyces sp. I05A-00742 TaxID=2732853 RepID=UPI0014881A82|nr:hypothetical protein [Streptomyces sp. I05A-00742]